MRSFSKSAAGRSEIDALIVSRSSRSAGPAADITGRSRWPSFSMVSSVRDQPKLSLVNVGIADTSVIYAKE
jgi:hypothetical protein